MEDETTLAPATTPDPLKRHARTAVVEKVDPAVRPHLQAQLPADASIPTRSIISSASGAALIKRMASRRQPTKELRTLMRGDGD